MSKCEIKKYAMYKQVLQIHCYPGEVWEYEINGNDVNLKKDNVTVTIPLSVFRENWTIKDDKTAAEQTSAYAGMYIDRSRV